MITTLLSGCREGPSEGGGRGRTDGAVAGATATLRAGACAVAGSRGARRLVGVRLVGSAADGGLQATLASLFFLNPERATTAGGVALASAVLVLPCTLLGSWAVPLLDRYSRRRVLVAGSGARALLALATATAALAGSETGVAAGVLAYRSVNRLLLAVPAGGGRLTLRSRPAARTPAAGPAGPERRRRSAGPR